jgi:hypothetical protein
VTIEERDKMALDEEKEEEKKKKLLEERRRTSRKVQLIVCCKNVALYSSFILFLCQLVGEIIHKALQAEQGGKLNLKLFVFICS